jgi:uncharacterized protein YcaQ
MSVTLETLRGFAVARSLFPPATLAQALETLGFIQADPIRAPARAQDLTLRHRVAGYHAGDLERDYPQLAVEEDTFINYGFVARRVYDVIHPRRGIRPLTAKERRLAARLLAFLRDRPGAHPRDIERQVAAGRVTNYWGGSSSASTHLLDLLHYRGDLRVAGRVDGVRTYVLAEPRPVVTDRAERQRRVDALVDVLVAKYAPLTARGLALVIRRLRYAAPQWRTDLDAAIRRARSRLASTSVDGTTWYWPASEDVHARGTDRRVFLLTPFDPVVWDRERFARLWGWEYRFEAYTPVAKRVRGYYALPLLWTDRVVGWGNVTVNGGSLDATFGYVSGRPPRERAFRVALDEELDQLRAFLELPGAG